VAAIVHDAGDSFEPELLDAVSDMVAVALMNQHLVDDVEAAGREVRSSRARLASTADRERRRIERDLHDGAQQRLVALRIELELLEDLIRRDPADATERVRALTAAAQEALDDIRSLAHGICPPLLTDHGLVEALRAAARGRILVDVHTRSIRRYAPEIESAVYFCALEALQNAQKHGSPQRVVIDLDGGGPAELRFVVYDDGNGAPAGALEGGAGIRNMRDRIAAVGGELTISSAPGVGTAVRGTVPLPSRRRAQG